MQGFTFGPQGLDAFLQVSYLPTPVILLGYVILEKCPGRIFAVYIPVVSRHFPQGVTRIAEFCLRFDKRNRTYQICRYEQGHDDGYVFVNFRLTNAGFQVNEDSGHLSAFIQNGLTFLPVESDAELVECGRFWVGAYGSSVWIDLDTEISCLPGKILHVSLVKKKLVIRPADYVMSVPWQYSTTAE